ncbi:MFS transporter, SP family, solute carrier family 2, member 8, partial [Paragonimus westermani]
NTHEPADHVDTKTNEHQSFLDVNNSQAQPHRFHWAGIPRPSTADRSNMYLAWLLLVLQALTGVGALLFFCESVFAYGGASWLKVYGVSIGLPQMIFTSVAAVLIRRVPRKQFLHCSTIIMSIAYLLLGLLLQAITLITVPPTTFNRPETRNLYVWYSCDRLVHISHIPYCSSAISNLITVTFSQLSQFQDLKPNAPLLVVPMVLCLVGYSLAWGPLPIVIASELLGTQFIGFTIGIGMTLHWLVSLAVIFLFEPILAIVGSFGCFGLMAVVCSTCGIFIHYHLPETGGTTSNVQCGPLNLPTKSDCTTLSSCGEIKIPRTKRI